MIAFEEKANTDRLNELDSSRNKLGFISSVIRHKSMDLELRNLLRFMVHATLIYVALGLVFMAGLVYVYVSFLASWPLRATMIWSVIGSLSLYVAWLENKPKS